MNRKRELVLVTFLAMAVFGLTYTMVLRQMAGTEDYNVHGQWAQMIWSQGFVELFKQDTYPLWEVCVAIVSRLFFMPVNHAAAVVSSVINSICYLLAYNYLKVEKQKEAGDIKVSLLTFCLMMIGPFYIPWYNEQIYLGQSAPNIWHNPTNLCVKPFTILIFCLILSMLRDYEEQEKISRRKWIALSILMIFSNLAKPSFAQIIIPGLGIYLCGMLIHSKGKDFMFALKIALAFVPSTLLMFGQYIVSFYLSDFSDGGVEIAWFEVMKLYSPNVLISVALGFLFPIYVLITERSIWKKRDVKLMFFVWLSSFLEYAMLAETGARRTHANFSWGYTLATFLVYMVCLKYFIHYNDEYDYDNVRQRVSVIIGWIIFFLQLFVGIYYFNMILTTDVLG